MKALIAIMVAIFGLMFTALFLKGCDRTEVQYSEELTEPAKVVDLVFMPSRHASDLSVGITSGGNISITPVNLDLPERYAVVFQCEHGKFVVEKDQEKTKALYQRLSRDQQVTVRYREVYNIVKNRDQIVSPKSFAKFDFIDAK